MAEKNLEQQREQIRSVNMDNKELNNVKRIITMLEKALERLLRRNYHNRNQYPKIALEIEEGINTLRGWIDDYQIYGTLPGFHLQISLAMKDLQSKIGQLTAMCEPVAGKKRIKKTA